MALLALFQPDKRTRARLRDALGEDHDLLECDDWSELWEVTLRRPVTACVVDPYNPFETVSLPELLHYRRRFPALALIIYADFRGRELDLYHLGRLGVDGVILSERHDAHRRIRDSVHIALSASLAKRVTDALGGVLPDLGIRCIGWAVEHAESEPQVSDLARETRMSSRALARELKSLGMPSPRHILLWGRLFQAARILESGSATVEEAAFRLGYATGASLGRALKDQTGHSPTEVVEEGGVDRILHAFLDAVRDRADGEGERRWSTAEVRRTVLRSFLRR